MVKLGNRCSIHLSYGAWADWANVRQAHYLTSVSAPIPVRCSESTHFEVRCSDFNRAIPGHSYNVTAITDRWVISRDNHRRTWRR